MAESNYGSRDKRGHYRPHKRVGYPPIFVWPLQPRAALKWVFAVPGYLVPWNVFYICVGVLSWFLLSPPLGAYAKISFQTFKLSLSNKNQDNFLLKMPSFVFKTMAFELDFDIHGQLTKSTNFLHITDTL